MRTSLIINAFTLFSIIFGTKAFVFPHSAPRSKHAATRASTKGIDASSSSISSNDFESKKEALKKTLRREYASFFKPMERQFYRPNVQFIDPLNNLAGVDAYQKNVDLLGARTIMGKILFSDAGIVLHRIDDLGPKQLQTRWTLRLTAKFFPWSPTARFTGVSIYDIDDEAKVLKQTDYWDSINLDNGEYQPVSKTTAIKDFLAQISPQGGAQQAMNAELPYELLRRGKEYEVRRYPAFEAVETSYENRPEGYDRLGTYASGWNEQNQKIRPFSPSIMKISKDEKNKSMYWPVGFSNTALDQMGGAQASQIPDPSDSIIRRTSVPSLAVAVIRFDNPATAPVVKFFYNRLMKLIKADGLVPTPESEAEYQVAQYDAIFSIGKRRNEVWAVLENHDWE